MTRLIRPYVSFEDVSEDIRAILDSGFLTTGPAVARFAECLCSYTAAAHAFPVSSATTALWVSLRLLGVGPGDEVIVSDFSFPATANVVEDLNAKPVFADVDRNTYNMRPEHLRARMGERTKAVIFVDALGNPTGIEQIRDLCRERGVPLLEDAACAIGSHSRGLAVGSIADITCFSFHPRKLITTGEGGAIMTNTDEYADRLSVKLSHGAVRPEGSLWPDFVDFGYNFRMAEIPAALGLRQLENLDEITARRRAFRDYVADALRPYGFLPQRIGADVVYNVQSLVFTVPAGVERNALVVRLRELGIETTLGTYCLSRTTYYRRKYNDVQPTAEWLNENTITLPCSDEADPEEVSRLVIEAART